ncbi:MAG: hypothetical protein Q9P01_01180 [Anaerolineae bacterium]|nr:hypothetical protein [Anaerolineae bacterium]
MNKLRTSLRFAYILALIPMGAIIIRAMQTPIIQAHTLGIIALLGLNITVMVLAGRLTRGFWTGYVALAAYVTWLTGGLLLALILIVVGTTLPIYWFYTRKTISHTIY